MIHIFCDSASMIQPDFASAHGVTVFPLSIELDGQIFKDEIEITPDQVLDALNQKRTLRTSQPNIGDKIDGYNHVLQNSEDEIIDLCIADGLSGTWQSALMAKEQCVDPSRVHVINTRTLAGPLKAIVERAALLAEDGKSVQEITAEVETMMEKEHSYLAVLDLDAIGRSGRIPKVAAKTGSVFHLVPVVEKTPDGTALKLNGVNRTMKKACRVMIEHLLAQPLPDHPKFYICHAQNEDAARSTARVLEQMLPQAEYEILPLCSLFCVHGGPGCVSVHVI